MHLDQDYASALRLDAFEQEAPPRLYLGSALVFGFCLFVAETEWPITIDSGDFNVQVNAQVASMQGSNVRQMCYVLVLMTGLLCLKFAHTRLSTWRSPMSVVFGSLVIWCCLSVTWAENSFTSFKRLLAYLFMVVGAAGASAFWSHRQILRYISYTGTALLIFGYLAEIAIGGFTPWYGDYRFGGGLHANVQSVCCAVLAVCALAAADTDPFHKTRFRLIALFGTMSLILTKSRSCLLGFAIAMILYTFYTRSLLARIGTALAVSITVVGLYMSGVLTQVTDFLSRNGEGVDNLTGRKPLWDLADLFLRERPWTGFGYHSFWTIAHIDFFSHEFGWPIGSAHNSYLEVMLNLGYVGLIFHVSLLLCGIILGGLYYRQTRSPIFAAISSLFFLIMVVGMFESAEMSSPGPYHFAYTVFIGCLCARHARDLASWQTLSATSSFRFRQTAVQSCVEG